MFLECVLFEIFWKDEAHSIKTWKITGQTFVSIPLKADQLDLASCTR